MAQSSEPVSLRGPLSRADGCEKQETTRRTLTVVSDRRHLREGYLTIIHLYHKRLQFRKCRLVTIRVLFPGRAIP
jgi:hypothetical protein